MKDHCEKQLEYRRSAHKFQGIANRGNGSPAAKGFHFWHVPVYSSINCLCYTHYIDLSAIVQKGPLLQQKAERREDRRSRTETL